jgi:hypothetical protein
MKKTHRHDFKEILTYLRFETREISAISFILELTSQNLIFFVKKVLFLLIPVKTLSFVFNSQG